MPMPMLPTKYTQDFVNVEPLPLPMRNLLYDGRFINVVSDEPSELPKKPSRLLSKEDIDSALGETS